MTAYISFTSSIVLPDGRSISASVEIPEGHPAIAPEGDLLDHTEYAQMGAAHMLRVVRSGDHHRARRAAEDEADAMNAEVVAKLTERAPF